MLSRVALLVTSQWVREQPMEIGDIGFFFHRVAKALSLLFLNFFQVFFSPFPWKQISSWSLTTRPEYLFIQSTNTLNILHMASRLFCAAKLFSAIIYFIVFV